MFFKIIHYGYENFPNVKQIPQNRINKTFNLELNVSLISNKAANLISAICSEINIVSIINKRLLIAKGQG